MLFFGGQAEQIEWKLFVQVRLSAISNGLQHKVQEIRRYQFNRMSKLVRQMHSHSVGLLAKVPTNVIDVQD